MRRWNSRLTALGLACAGLLLAGAPAFAQSSGGSIGGSGSSGGSFGGSSSFGGGSSSGGAFGGGSSFGSPSSSGGSSFAGGSSFTGGTAGQTSSSSTSGVPGRSGPSAAVGATSFLGANYGNPLAPGMGTGNATKAAFGSPLFTLTNTGTASIRSRTVNPTSSYYGSPIGVRRLPAYATSLKIKNMPPPETPLQVRTDLQVMLARSPQLDARDAVRVFMDGPAVVLRGVVADNDERRLVENMILLTPGVNVVHNELATRSPAP